MIDQPETHLVCNKIFSVILTAYIDGLKKSIVERKKRGDVSDRLSYAFWIDYGVD